MKRGIAWMVVLSVLGVGGAFSAEASVFNSTNFTINGNLGDSVAGGQGSTNYQLTSAGGESIAGRSASASYKLGQGYMPTLENSLQVVVQPKGLVGYWPLDNSAPGATAFDESSNSNNGVYSAGSSSTTLKVGNAWSGAGAESITIPDSPIHPSGDKMTIITWLKPAAATGGSTAISKWNSIGASSNGSWALQLAPDGKQLRFVVSSGTGDEGINYATSGASVTWDFFVMLNFPVRVVVTYDGSLPNAERVKFYYTGGLQSGTIVTGTIPTSLNDSPDNIVIGNTPGRNIYWQGVVDDVKLYDRVLTQGEIKADHDATNIGIPAGLTLGNITPGVSQSTEFDAIVQTSAPGYSLAINQNNNLTSGANTVPGVSGSIASPVSWSEGTTKGLGFTLLGTNATAAPGIWSSGNSYAALPATATSFYTRTGFTGGAKDIINMRLKLDTASSQTPGVYSNQTVITGTITP